MINGDGSSQKGTIEQTTMAAEITGEPFDLPAGPVSLALSIEHRKDEVNVVADILSTTGGHLLGNVPGLVGAQSVTEGAVETVVPIVNGASWAQSWDINAAVRATDYELSGYVTTWKVGTTWAPIDDIRFRLTRSRDIRAPNLQELFTPVQIGSAQPQIIDRFQPGSPQYALGTTNSTGNPALLPERADTTGIGVVLSPQFLPGFTASVDYWDVNIKGAIRPLAVQQVIDTCFTGQFPDVCPNIIRDPTTGNIRQIRLYSINLATENVRGVDLEASYRAPLSDLISDWPGAISLHGNMTFYLRNFQDNTFNKPTNRVGENNGSTPPDWRLTANASYVLDPISVTLTARSVSKGLLDARYIECTSGCPAATPDNPTVNDNSVPGTFYIDANVTYKFAIGEEAEGEFFIAAKNLFNRDPPPLVTSYFANSANTGTLFDPLGTVYRAGIRFRM